MEQPRWYRGFLSYRPSALEALSTVVKRSVGIKKAQALVKAVTNSIGRTNGHMSSEAILQNLLAEYELYRM